MGLVIGFLLKSCVTQLKFPLCDVSFPVIAFFFFARHYPHGEFCLLRKLIFVCMHVAKTELACITDMYDVVGHYIQGRSFFVVALLSLVFRGFLLAYAEPCVSFCYVDTLKNHHFSSLYSLSGSLVCIV